MMSVSREMKIVFAFHTITLLIYLSNHPPLSGNATIVIMIICGVISESNNCRLDVVSVQVLTVSLIALGMP